MIPLVNTKQAAHLLGVSPGMVRKLTRQGALNPRRIGRAVRYAESDLEQLVKLADGDTEGEQTTQ